MYVGKVFLDKAEIDFEGMDTEAERQRHLERLAADMLIENAVEVVRGGERPVFYIQVFSSMNDEDFSLPGWREIIKQVGSEKARNDITFLVHQLSIPPK